jgi:hypothetical protein
MAGTVRFEGFLGSKIKEDTGKIVSEGEKKKKRILDYYEDLMNNEELIQNITFSQSDKTKGVFFFEQGIKIFMPKEEIMHGFETSDIHINTLKRNYCVKVIEVDREKECVTVSFIKAKEMVRPKVLKEIDKVLNEGRVYKAQARVSFITDSNTVAFVDILGLGIRGVVFAQEWSVGFTRDISMVAKIGDIIEVAITNKSKKYDEKDPQYECSRKAMISTDPWEGIEERAPLHSNVIVTCVYKGKKNFLGKISGLDEISAYCLYPDKDSATTGEPIIIHKGEQYRGYVQMISEAKQVFRVRILDKLSTEK